MNCRRQFIPTFLRSRLGSRVIWTQCVRRIGEDHAARKREEAFRTSEVMSLLGESLEAFTIEEKREPVPGKSEPAKRLKPIDRSQSFWGAIYIEKLIEEDHPARGIWAMVTRLDLRRLEEKINAVEGRAGQNSL